MGKIIEGYWDCPYCNSKGIRGGIATCPHCGRTRDSSTKFYMKGTTPISNEESKKVSLNPDWLCSYCESYNSDFKTVCNTCGHTRDESDKNYFEINSNNDESETQSLSSIRNDSVKTESESPEPDYMIDSTDNYNNRFSKDENNLTFKEKTLSFLNENGFKLLIIAFGVILSAFIVFAFIPKPVTVNVDQLEWKTTVSIERYQTVSESNWILPPTARLSYTRSEIHHYDKELSHYETKTRSYTVQVLDGYDTVVTGHRDMGNGYFQEQTTQVPRYRTENKSETYQEPVYNDVAIYQTKYYYDIDKWLFERSVLNNGFDKTPTYSQYVLNEDERVSSKETKYYLTATDNKKEKTYTSPIDQEIWNILEEEMNIKVKINSFGQMFIDIESLSSEKVKYNV